MKLADLPIDAAKFESWTIAEPMSGCVLWTGATVTNIAREYGLHITSVRRIKRGRTWASTQEAA